MNKYEKFFELAKQKGISEAELRIHSSHSLSMSLFHGEIDNYTDNDTLGVVARGIYNRKCGSAAADTFDNKTIEFLVDEIYKNASIIENDDPIIIYKGSEKYHKVNTYNKKFEKVPYEEKLKKLLKLESSLKNFDKRIFEVSETDYEESSSCMIILNSHGLKLTQKNNLFIYGAQCIAKEGEQTKSNYDIYLGNDFDKFNPEELANKIAKEALAKLGGEPCETKKYKAVLSPDVVNSFLSVFVSYADSEDVQKKSSLFIDKIGKKVASKKITIEDRPLQKNLFTRWFDDEGVATYNKAIVKKGILQTYLYNLTTATKEGRESTGNGYGNGSKKGCSSSFTYLKPGKKSQQELFEQMGDGVYITEITGLHAGLNGQSGNFSLQSTGFLIENGKIKRPLDIITIGGNIIDIFKDVIEVGNDTIVTPSGNSCQSLLIKKLSVSGK